MTRTKAQPTTADQIHKLARSTRSRANLEKIQTILDVLKDDAGPLSDLTTEIVSLNEAISTVRKDVTSVDASLMPPQYAAKLLDALNALYILLPHDEDPVMGISEPISNAITLAEQYELSLEETRVSAEDREETWEALQEQLIEIGNALDTLTALGTDKAEAGTEDTAS
ncbi:hypothetical protein [Streptomyces sp. CBMA29]|uniref:hypothetical protein n=1 Tax=Streptomyces sp. CBMA29 TaxID=1896314 RepID=UPI001661B791|nr:hypothetical protein [Streptomyces sp. CBMA29]MBD0733982.1 hypothetical protein [Streptomyces sp. CBMA29]